MIKSSSSQWTPKLPLQFHQKDLVYREWLCSLTLYASVAKSLKGEKSNVAVRQSSVNAG